MDKNDWARMAVAVLLGHTEHCACRIAFGDGECECGCPRLLLLPRGPFAVVLR